MSSLPKVTVLMPVYNGADYLGKAMESILSQTFGDFELLIINDGSTDNSVDIVESFRDPRINLVHNQKNLGLIATLNRGIELARGEYIARMDCDDICLPERLEHQSNHLDRYPDCAVIASRVIMISATGVEVGEWNDDAACLTADAISKRLPRTNCIAHPSIMTRRSILKIYGYDPAQSGCEDYDLWLRMAADGAVIEKLEQPLLRYRITPGSVTATSTGSSTDLKNMRTKLRFFQRRMRENKVNKFVLKVGCDAFKDLGYHLAKQVIAALSGIFRPPARETR